MVPGVEVGNQNQPKIHQKNIVQDKMLLGIDFTPILVGFWSQVGKKSPPNIDQKRHPKNDAEKGL